MHYAGEKLEGEIGIYVNYINNYIYLQPHPGSYAITYEGTFPLFYFTQTDALYRGLDADVKWYISSHLMFEPKVTLVYANDLVAHNYLVLVPPQNYQATLEYKWKVLRKFSDVFINCSGIYVAKQNRVPPNSDFVPPPDGYFLINASIGFSIPVAGQKININLEGDNLCNTAYRDYLNFFRYYADNPGRSLRLRVQIPFQIINK